MEFAIIAAAALLASLLTFFSGFGLGTILTPVFVIFFPVEIAIALTGIVHLLNNFFKIGLIGSHINWKVGLRFGAASVLGSFLGAGALIFLAGDIVVYQYTLGGNYYSVTAIKLSIALLMVAFALFESVPSLKSIQFNEDKLVAGGIISGFFGGFSGNQGALRSMFLVRSGLGKEAFIATGILIACGVDVTRLTIYFSRFSSINIQENIPILATAILAAFAGAYLGSKLLKKITLGFVQNAVAIMIFLLAIALGSGFI